MVRAQGDQQAGEALAFQPAARYAPIMDQVYEELVTRCAQASWEDSSAGQ